MAEKKDFTAIMEALCKGNFPFAVYRAPGENEVRIVIDHDPELNVVTDAGKDRGFVFAPFASDSVPAVLLRPAALTRVPVSDLPYARTDEEAVFDYGDEISLKQHYTALVEKALDALSEGVLKKIVTSRCVKIPYAYINVAGLFAAMCAKYPESFVYYFSHPQVGQWAGATPELLLLRRGKEIHTMSLAGTIPYQGEQMYRWDTKNVEEQAIVSVFIKDALERSGVATVSVSKPGNQVAGPVVHLCSHINGQAPKDMDMNVLLKNLAPTPALCGYPRKEAMEFIRRYEGYLREFYGGYLGELNMAGEDSAELYVNIRCLQVAKEDAILYAGGGVVPGSEPESEWEETSRKLSAVGSVLGGFITIR